VKTHEAQSFQIAVKICQNNLQISDLSSVESSRDIFKMRVILKFGPASAVGLASAVRPCLSDHCDFCISL
jgi:hypothetical protein